MPPEARHFWSPHLEVGFDETGDNGSRIDGVFGPRPALWSIFVAAYAAIGFLGVMGVTFGMSQWILGTTPWVLWSGPIAVILAAVVFGIARIGRRLGTDQMVIQLSWIEDVTSATTAGSQTSDTVSIEGTTTGPTLRSGRVPHETIT